MEIMALSGSPYCSVDGCKKLAQRKGMCASHFWDHKHQTTDGKYIDRNMGMEILETSRLIGIPISKLHDVIGIGKATLYAHTEGAKSRMYRASAIKVLTILKREREKELKRLKQIDFLSMEREILDLNKVL